MAGPLPRGSLLQHTSITTFMSKTLQHLARKIHFANRAPFQLHEDANSKGNVLLPCSTDTFVSKSNSACGMPAT